MLYLLPSGIEVVRLLPVDEPGLWRLGETVALVIDDVTVLCVIMYSSFILCVLPCNSES